MSTSNQNKGADRQSCPRAEWLIALFWLEKAATRYNSWVWTPWDVQTDIAMDALRSKAFLLQELFETIPCTVPGCEYCGRPMTRGVAGNTHRDAMDQTFELDGRQFRVIVQEQAGQHWIAANSRDIPRETVAEWLEEMARRVREGGQ